MNPVWRWFHQLGSPPYFYRFATRWMPWFGISALLLTVIGMYLGFVEAPADYLQGDSFRIMYIHVPAAWMSMFIYGVMALNGAIALIWRIKLSELLFLSCAPIGAMFTAITLITGMFWGKPTWGAYWVWDARLTSQLLLLFLYFGFIALTRAIEDPRRADRAGAIIALVGAVNVPIIYFSVQWWNTLHQGASVSLTKAPSMATTMLTGMLVMALASWAYTLAVVLWRVRPMILERERHTEWVGAELERAARLSQTAGGRA